MPTKPRGEAPAMELDYLAFRLDLVSAMLKDLATVDYEHEFDVDVRDLRVLRFVAMEPGLIQGRLASLCLLEKGATSKLVSAMVKRGLLERQVGSVDARHIELRLTRRGAQVVARCDEIGHALEHDLLQSLPPADRRAFERSVQALIASLRERHAAKRASEAEAARRKVGKAAKARPRAPAASRVSA